MLFGRAAALFYVYAFEYACGYVSALICMYACEYVCMYCFCFDLCRCLYVSLCMLVYAGCVWAGSFAGGRPSLAFIYHIGI